MDQELGMIDRFLIPPWEWFKYGDAFNETFGALFSSLLVMLIIMILAIIVNIMARKADPLKKPKGLLFLFEFGVGFFDGMAEDMMGPKFKGFGGFIFAIATYLFIAFIFGLTGLPAPMTNLAIPLSLGFMTFALIHITSARFTKWKYFKRYIDPFPFFLPINLLSMWAPLLSLTFRLFGNALAGWALMNVVYMACDNLSAAIFTFLSKPASEMFIAPFITPVLHAYFDLFSGFVQTTVFIMLTMLFLANEVPEDDEIQEQLSV